MGKVKKKILHVTTDLTTDLTSKSSPLLKHVRVLSVSGVALAQVWCSGVMGPHRGTGGTFHNACLRQMLGLHHGPGRPSTAELADLRWHRVRWLGQPVDVIVVFTPSIPSHPRPMGRPHRVWMDTASRHV